MSHYKIMIETTNSKKQAQDRVNTLKSHQITSHIQSLNFDNQIFYSVQAGPYSMKKAALENVDKIKHLGVKNAFITTDTNN